MTRVLLKYLRVIALCLAASASVISLTDPDKALIKAMLDHS
jgi:hypothetical protein